MPFIDSTSMLHSVADVDQCEIRYDVVGIMLTICAA